MKIELELPEEYRKIYERLVKEVNLSKVFSRAFVLALQERLEEEIAFEKLKKIASKSKLSARDAKKLSEELKERIAKRHGLL
jgi:polyhydroxyalkanoate synthesis regulator phasin